MTKTDLVDAIAADLQLTKHQTATVVELFLQCIADALRKGDHVELCGFGSFRLRHRRARTARNPRTGAPVQLPAKRSCTFSLRLNTRGLSGDHHRSKKVPSIGPSCHLSDPLPLVTPSQPGVRTHVAYSDQPP